MSELSASGFRAPGVRTPGVESPRKVLRMLLEFSEDRPVATVRELAGAADTPLSTAYRYVALLRELGLLEELPGGRYQVSPRIRGVALAAEQADHLARAAQPLMTALTGELGETTMLVRVVAGAAVCVERVESARPVRLSVQPGQPLPLWSGASGKALLASLTEPERSELLANATDAPAGHERTCLESELSLIAERGWSESRGEIDDGIWACAALVRRGDAVPAALTLAGPEYRIDDTDRERIRTQLLDAAVLLAA